MALRKKRAALQSQGVRTINMTTAQLFSLIHVRKAPGDGSILKHIFSKHQCLGIKWFLGENKKHPG